MKKSDQLPQLLIVNQMAGPHAWELTEALGKRFGHVALLTGHPDTLKKGSNEAVSLFPSVPLDRGSTLRRIWSWIRFIAHACFWVLRWSRSTPILLFSNPPILCWLGYVMWLLRRQPYLVIVYDIYPDLLIGLGELSAQNLLVRLWRVLNRRAYERALLVDTLGETMAACLEEQFDSKKTLAGHVSVHYLWVDTDWIKPIPKENNQFACHHNLIGKTVVMYSGNMGMGHDIETMLEAARLLQQLEHIRFIFIGSGPKWRLVEEAVHQWNLQNVDILSWQPEDMLPYSLAAADISLVSIEKGIDGLVIPSKAVYAMAAGSAMAALCSSNGEISTWLDDYRCGVILEPGDASILSEILENLAADTERLRAYRANARSCAMALFDRRTNVDALVAYLVELLFQASAPKLTPKDN